MFLIYLAAFVAACGAAKLDRTYLPPPSAASAGGSPGSLQLPLTRALDRATQNIPPGGFANEHQGIVVEAAAPGTAGTRASSQQSGLGGSRDSYGSTDSKVGNAAFRVTSNHQNPNVHSFVPGGDFNPDLSAFYQPMSAFRPGNVQIIRDYISNTIKYHNDIDLNKFNYAFETDNGIKAAGSGVAINGVQAQGGYSYTGDDGRVYSVSYTAGEGGFQPQGSHLPTPPPIPIEILKSLEQNAKDEAAGIIDDGSYDAKKYNAGGDYTKSDVNSEYNDRQSNKFGERPGSADGSGTIINQNQQATVTSGFNGQMGFIHGFALDKHVNSNAFKQTNGASNFNIMGNRNTFPKIEYNNQFISGFGSRNEYLPPNRGNSESFSHSAGNKDIKISQQKLQTQVPFGAFQFGIVGPSSYEISSGTISQSANNQKLGSTPSNNVNNQGSISSFNFNQNINPSAVASQSNNPLGNLATGNIFDQSKLFMQQSTLEPSNNSAQNSFTQSFGSVFSFPPQSTQSAQQFHSTNSPLQFESNQNLSNRLPTTQLSTTFGSFNPSLSNVGQSQYTNRPSSTFDTSFSSVRPTIQPQITVTTPLQIQASDPFSSLDFGKTELLNSTTGSDFTTTDGQPSKVSVPTSSKKEQLPTQSTSIFNDNDFPGFSSSSFNTRPETTLQIFDNTQTTQTLQNSKPQVTQAIFVTDVMPNTQKPAFTGQINQFTGPIQHTADHSYIYKPPLIPFNTPFGLQQSNNLPNRFQFDKVTQSVTTPQDSTSTTQYQTQSTINNSPNPTTIEPYISSYINLRENESNENTYQATNGITQATISSFPAISHTDASNSKYPFQQSELSINQFSFTQPSTTPTTVTAETMSTLLNNQNYNTQSQLSVEDNIDYGLTKIDNKQHTGEIYHYNKPAQELSSQTQKEAELSIKTERPQFAVSSSQFSLEGSTISMGQNYNQRGESKPHLSQDIEESIINNRFNQQTNKEAQSTTQFPQAGLNSNEYTYSLFQQHTSPGIGLSNYKPSNFFPSTVPSKAFNAEKEGSQTSTTLSDNPTYGLQYTTQFDGSSTKESTSSNFQQPNQQTETQFNNQPSTPISGASNVTPGITEHTQLTSISQRFDTQPSIDQNNSENKSTLSQFQQSVTQFTYNPSTSISNVDPLTLSGFNTQSLDKKFSFPTSFVQTTATDKPTQFSTQESEESFESKRTTISNFKLPSHQSSTSFSETSTLIPSTSQTETLPGLTQSEEIYDYKKPTEELSTPSQNENDEQSAQSNNRFGTQSNNLIGHQTTTIFQSDQSTQFGQQTQQPQFNDEPSTQFNQKVTEKETTQSYLTPSEAVSNIEYNTASTLDQNSPQFQPTFNIGVSDQTSTTGEIYEYTKPEQGLSSDSQKSNEELDQNNQENRNGGQSTIPDESNLGTKQTTNSQSTQSQTSSGIFDTHKTVNSQNDLTTQSFPGTKPFDTPTQFSFRGSCCNRFKNKSSESTTTTSIPTIDSNPSVQNRIIEQDTEKNNVEEIQNGNKLQVIEPQKGSQTYAGVGEEFGGPRKPPSFDETGYHY